MNRRAQRAAQANRQRSYVKCGLDGCDERIPRGMLLCRPHWFRLPRMLRQAISSSWQERHTRGLGPWSANVLEARRYLSTNTPAAITARITGDHS